MARSVRPRSACSDARACAHRAGREVDARELGEAGAEPALLHLHDEARLIGADLVALLGEADRRSQHARERERAVRLEREREAGDEPGRAHREAADQRGGGRDARGACRGRASPRQAPSRARRSRRRGRRRAGSAGSRRRRCRWTAAAPPRGRRPPRSRRPRRFHPRAGSRRRPPLRPDAGSPRARDRSRPAAAPPHAQRRRAPT